MNTETAACANVRYAYLFDPPSGVTVSQEDRERYALAAILCGKCPVRNWCATDRTVKQSEGFRAGLLYTRNHHKTVRIVVRRLQPPKPKRKPRPHIERTEKRCPHCEQTKPIDQYHRDRTTQDGRCAHCKECRAIRDGTVREDGEIDEVAVQRIIDGTLIPKRRPGGGKSPVDLVEAVRRLAAAGWSDPQIERHLDYRRGTMQKFRRRNGIPLGVPCNREGTAA